MCWAVLGPDRKSLYASNYVTNMMNDARRFIAVGRS